MGRDIAKTRRNTGGTRQQASGSVNDGTIRDINARCDCEGYFNNWGEDGRNS
jgi:hypothetical protein